MVKMKNILVFLLLLAGVHYSSSRCVNWCSKHGDCTSPGEDGYCICEYGYSGDDCGIKLCPKAYDPVTIGSYDNRRTLSLELKVDDGILIGYYEFSFYDTKVILPANANQFDSEECTRAIQSLPSIREARCVREKVNVVTGEGKYIISILKFPEHPYENNINYHNGNPDITSFHCDITKINKEEAKRPQCILDDVITDKLPPYLNCGGHGTCDANGQCKCEIGYHGAACDDTTDRADQYVFHYNGPYFTGSLVKLNSYRNSSDEFNIFAATLNGGNVTVIGGDKVLTHYHDMVVRGGVITRNSFQVSSTSNEPYFIGKTRGTENVIIFNDGSFYSQGDLSLVNEDSKHELHGVTTISNAVIETTVTVQGTATLSNYVQINDDLHHDVSSPMLHVKSKKGVNNIIVIEGSSDKQSLLRAVLNGTALFDLDAEGTIKTTGMKVNSGGIDVVSGGVNVMSGGMKVAGGLTLQSGGLTLDNQEFKVGKLSVASASTNVGSPLLEVTSTNADYVGAMLSLSGTSNGHNSNKYSFVKAVNSNGNSLFELKDDGSVVTAGDVNIQHDLAVARHTSLAALSFTTTEIYGGDNIHIPAHTSSVKIVPGTVRGKNVLHLPGSGDGVSPGAMLIINNQDTEATTGPFAIKPSTSIIVFFDGNQWIDVQALHVPFEKISGVQEFTAANDLDMGNYTLTVGRIRSSRMRKGSIPIAATGGILVESPTFTYDKGVMSVNAIKTNKLVLSNIDGTGSIVHSIGIERSDLKQVTITDSSLELSPGSFKMHNAEGVAFFKDGVLQSGVDFAQDLNLNISSLAVSNLVVDGSKDGLVINGYRNTLLYCDEFGRVVPYVDDNKDGSMKLSALEVLGMANAQAVQVQRGIECDELKSRTISAGDIESSGSVSASKLSGESAKYGKLEVTGGSVLQSLSVLDTISAVNVESSGSVSASKLSGESAKYGKLEVTGGSVLQSLSVLDSVKAGAIDSAKVTAEAIVVNGTSELHTVKVDDVLSTSSLVLTNDAALEEYDNNNFLTIDTKGAVRSITMSTLAANIPITLPKQVEFDQVDIKNELITESIQLTIPNQQNNFLYVDKNNRITPSAALKLSNENVMITTNKFQVNGMTDLIGATYIEGSLNVHGSVVGSGPYMDSSDVRFKTNITNITSQDALIVVDQLRPVSYSHKIDEFPFLTAGNHIGFIADEVEQVMPEIVSSDDQGYKAIAYSRLTAMNTGAIQALHDKINELEKQVRRLTEIIEKMVD